MVTQSRQIKNNAVAVASLATYNPGLITQVTTADTGSKDYFTVFLINTTSSNITITSAELNIAFVQSVPTIF